MSNQSVVLKILAAALMSIAVMPTCGWAQDGQWTARVTNPTTLREVRSGKQLTLLVPTSSPLNRAFRSKLAAKDRIAGAVVRQFQNALITEFSFPAHAAKQSTPGENADRSSVGPGDALQLSLEVLSIVTTPESDGSTQTVKVRVHSPIRIIKVVDQAPPL